MDQPSDHLLRTFGAIPASSRVLDLGCGRGVHTEPLARLGFDVFACDTSPEAVEHVCGLLSDLVGAGEAERRCSVSRPDALGYGDGFFDWVVAFDTLARAETREEIVDLLGEARRVLKPGGWLYVAVPALQESSNGSRGYAGDSGLMPSFTPRTLDEIVLESGYAISERPSVSTAGERRRVQGIYRKVDVDTPA